MIHAPQTPTTTELHERYPLNEVTQLKIDINRQRVGNILSGEEQGVVGLIGACAMTDDTNRIRIEGHAQHQITQTEEGLYLVNRRPFWKPRTNPSDWHGLETDDPELAYRTVAGEAIWGSGVAAELNWQDAEHSETHAYRYGPLLTFGWIGGRAVQDSALMERTAMDATMLPLGIKNGLDGEVGPALEQIEKLRELRGENGAPVVLLYRGGENAQNPEDWERQYRYAMEATNGKMIVDGAHGTEMAHHPAGNFKKSVEGQLNALKHIEQIASKGELPTGVMFEASDAHSPTDPHIRHADALGSLLQLNQLRRDRVTVT